MLRVGWTRGSWLRSIRLRILAVVIGLLLVSSIGSVVLLRAALFDRLDEEVGISLESEAEEFRLLSAGNDPQTGEAFDGDLAAIFDVYFGREVADEGETLLSFLGGELYESRRAQDAAGVDELEGAIAYWSSLEEPESGEIETPAGQARYVAIPLEGSDQNGLFVVANFPDFERSEIDTAVRTQVAAQLVTLVVASLVGFLLAGRVLAPLRSLAATARLISDTDLTQRIPVDGRDEASQIAVTFNGMLTRLEGAFTSQRSFLDDTSHELRTPLTVVRGHLELLDTSSTAQERQETVALVTDEVDRMSRIVNDLFLLARADQPDFLTLGQVDLRELVVAVHRKASALADRDWQVEAPAPVWVTVDRHRLTQAMLQLADNAVKFTREGQMIRLGGASDGTRAVLWVHDSGQGVPPGAAETVFERFDRGTQRRDETTAGAGLGLAIVRAIAEAHGGGVELVDEPGDGARFEITLPLR